MTEPLSQEEINSLLSGISGNKENARAAKLRRLYEEFLENNKSFNAKIIKDLISIEMKNRQDEADEITHKYMKKEITKEYALKKTKELGYGLWWGSESQWFIVGVKDFSFNKTNQGSFEIKARCYMEYISSHVVYGENEMERQAAKITMKINGDFATEEFIFSWR